MQTLEFLEKWISDKGLPKYRAKQIYQAITKNLISNWDEAIELPKEWEETLTKELPISMLNVKDVFPRRGELHSPRNNGHMQHAPTDAPTIKIAFQAHDDLVVESVLMRHKEERNTVCVSTQVGCPMNCAFCATGKMGFTRNLSSEEIVDQVLEFARILKNDSKSSNQTLHPKPSTLNPQRVTNIVFMGMGEPFLNYENVMEAIKILNDKDGFNLGHRHMTISTSGIVPGILKFADEKIQVNLAISLHAPNNEIRDSIMPVNKLYPLEKLLPTVSEYMEKTGRKVFFEYILLKGINDSQENIDELINLMQKYFADQMQLVHINLIEYNEVSQNPTDLKSPKSPKCPTFQSPDHQKTREIFDYLQKNKILTTIRYRFGDDIAAACGQLAGR